MPRVSTSRDDAPAYLIRYENRRGGRARRAGTRRRRARLRRPRPRPGHRAGPGRARPGRLAAGPHRGLRPRDDLAPGAPVPRVVPQPDGGQQRRPPHPPRPDAGLHLRRRPHPARSLAGPPQGPGPGPGPQGGHDRPPPPRPDRSGAGDRRRRAGGHPAGAEPLRHRRRDRRGSGAGRDLRQLPGVVRRQGDGRHRGLPAVRPHARGARADLGRRPARLDGRDAPLLQHRGRRPATPSRTGCTSRCTTSSRPSPSSAGTGRASSSTSARARPDLRLYVCGHSGPIRAVAAAAVGHDPGEPYNVEDVRIRVFEDREHAIVTYRGRGVELEIPTAVTASWQ